MSNNKLFQQMLGLILALLLLAGCSGAPAQPAATPTPVPPIARPALPSVGKWTGKTEFGSVTFTVNPKGTGITYVQFTFSSYNCGGGKTLSGSVGTGQETGWDGKPITNGQFTYDSSILSLTGTFDPSGTSASGTWTYLQCSSSGAWAATPTAIPATPTPNPNSSLKIGDTFTAGDYEVKLNQVVAWDKVTILTSNGFDTLPPKGSGNSWLIVALEINSKSAATALNLGNLTSVLALVNTDAVLVDATGQKYGLSGVGTSVADRVWSLTLIAQTPSTMTAIFQGTPSGNVFIQPGGRTRLAVVQNPLQDGRIVLSQESLLADPAVPKWYVGLEKQGAESNVARFGLLFEVPTDTPELSLQLLGTSLPANLPKPERGIPSQPKGSGGLAISSMTLTHSEMCKAWQDLIPCDSAPAPTQPVATLTQPAPTPTQPIATLTQPAPTPTTAQSSKSGVPIIQSVELREDTSSGELVIYQDIHFSDSDGDVTRVDYKIVSTTNPDVQVEGGKIDISSEEQKVGTFFTGKWGCGGGNYSVTLSATLTDRAGNHSEPYEYTMVCK